MQESSVLQVVTLFSKVVMVSEQAPVRVELMVISWQLDSMLELQLDNTEPWLAALLADLKRKLQLWRQLAKELVCLVSGIGIGVQRTCGQMSGG